MKILWYSSSPVLPVGYGVATQALITRMSKDGHFVKVATKHSLGGNQVYEGIEIFEGLQSGLLNKIVEEEGYDYLISLFDAWVLQEPFVNWVASVLLDTEWIHPKMISSLKGSRYQIALTQHGKQELERAGFKPFYAPLGVDTQVFHPDADLRKETRKKFGWKDETFVVGLVGINYPGDRKNIVGLIRAFQRFHERHPDTILYLHTDVMGTQAQGLPLIWLAEKCGFREGDQAFQYVEQKAYHTRNISTEEMVEVYNALDVFCLPHKGEGFGFPLVEAQACGCPIITTETTSGKELCKGGWLIPTKDDHYTPSSLLTWVVFVNPSDIDHKLEVAYKAWKNGSIKKQREKARQGMLEYDWDVVYDRYWRPLLKKLEEKPVVVETLPRYFDIYPSFQGRPFMVDCARLCNGSQVCQGLHPLLTGEEDQVRPILSRSFPIYPNEEGELVISTSCPVYRWVSPRFISECSKTWQELWSYPQVRREVAKLWKNGALQGRGPFIKLSEVKREFDSSYAEALQALYLTTFELSEEVLSLIPAGGSVLDVGAGDGRRVRFLLEKGFDAIGTEVNPHWIDGDLVVRGDALALPFPEESFDVVLCVDVLEHLPEPRQGLSELLRVTKQTGKVLVQITPTDDPTFYEDITHIVPWTREQWKREIFEHCEILRSLPQGFGLALGKIKELQCP